MRKTRSVVSRSSALFFAVIVCFAPVGTAPAANPAGGTARPITSEDTLAGLGFESVSLVVYKRQRALVVYEFGARKREYPVVLGANPDGDKRFEGDLRTPEGLYRIDGIRPHKRWRYFLSINYPNAQDRSAYESSLREGLIPTLSGRAVGIGGWIGIHGTDKPVKQQAAEDWTRGCIAMYNSDIDDLRARVRVGTPVLIVKGDQPIADHLTTVIGSHRVDGSADPR